MWGFGTQLVHPLGYIPCSALKWERALGSALEQEVHKGRASQDKLLSLVLLKS